jgi:hypothetical protein
MSDTEQQALIEATQMAVDLKSAETLSDLDQLYVNWIGHSTVEDDSTATAESVRRLLTEYLAEFCSATGVDPSAVGL